MAPPQHKVDATLQAMEKAHRATPNEQVQNFSRTINVARRDFEKFASAEENASRQNESAGGSLLALVENEQAIDKGLDRSLEQVKESLAEMERKRMLALGAMTRLSPEEALAELVKVKEHILNLSLRIPIRADFIVHGHNISLSIFRLFEAAERAEAEVDALINAKRSLDSGAGDSGIAGLASPASMNPTQMSPTPMSPTPMSPMPMSPTQMSPTPVSSTPMSPTPVSPTPVNSTPEFNPETGTYQAPSSAVPASQQATQPPQVQYNDLELETAIEPVSQPYSGAYDLSENYNAEIDLGAPIKASEPARPRTTTTAGMRLKKALQKSAQSTPRSPRSVSGTTANQHTTEASSQAPDDALFKGGNEEYDL